MSADHTPTPKLFIAIAAMVIVLSAAAVIFAAVHGPVSSRPHATPPNSHSPYATAYSRPRRHAPPWWIPATIWVASVANRLTGA